MQLKTLLLNSLKETEELNNTLALRCDSLDKLISLFDRKFDINHTKDLNSSNIISIKYNLNQINASLMKASQSEIELAAQRRDNQYKK